MADEKIPWHYQPWVVVLLIFLVLGPFGLPLLYKSPRFDRRAKAGLTVLTVAYTAYLVWMILELVKKLSFLPFFQP